jgi:phosphoenolpyruvate carboxykinase (ATP)
MELGYTRAMVHAALDGSLAEVETRTDPHFGFQVPVSCPNVPDDILDPCKTWENCDDYDAQAKKLVAMFDEAYEKLEESSK